MRKHPKPPKSNAMLFPDLFSSSTSFDNAVRPLKETVPEGF